MSGSVFYEHASETPFAARLLLHMRRKMFRLLQSRFEPRPEWRVLDVGVTSDQSFEGSNFFEKMYPFPERITCVGTEDGSHLAREFPGLHYRQVRAGDKLPFADGEFDLVFSNAVVEHAGSRRDQAAFVAELCRVGKRFFITTPSRWFPVEHHTALPLLHYLPPPAFRRLIRNTRYGYWADEANLNILTRREFANLFPEGARPEIRMLRAAGLPCNMAAISRSSEVERPRASG